MNEGEYTPHLLAAVNMAGRPTRLWRQNAGRFVKRDKRGRTMGVVHGAPKGAADLTGDVRPEGWRLEVELKSPNGRQTAEQKAWQARTERQGGVYVLCHIADGCSLEDNLADHVAAIDAAIEVRRARR